MVLHCFQKHVEVLLTQLYGFGKYVDNAHLVGELVEGQQFLLAWILRLVFLFFIFTHLILIFICEQPVEKPEVAVYLLPLVTNPIDLRIAIHHNLLLDILPLLQLFDVFALQSVQRPQDACAVSGEHLELQAHPYVRVVLDQRLPLCPADCHGVYAGLGHIVENAALLEEDVDGPDVGALPELQPQLLLFVYLVADIVAAFGYEVDLWYSIELFQDVVLGLEVSDFELGHDVDHEVLIIVVGPVVIGVVLESLPAWSCRVRPEGILIHIDCFLLFPHVEELCSFEAEDFNQEKAPELH